MRERLSTEDMTDDHPSDESNALAASTLDFDAYVDDEAPSIEGQSTVDCEESSSENDSATGRDGDFSSSKKNSSLELRRLPPNNLLTMDDAASTSSAPLPFVMEDDDHVVLHHPDSDNSDKTDSGGFLRKTCLNSRFSLRTQLMLTFGPVNALTIMFVTALCVIISMMAAHSVKSITYNSFDDLMKGIEGTSARYIAEHLSPKLIPEDLVQIIYESVQDRFVGYPHYPGYEDDRLVPFYDVDSKVNRYPIIGEPLPLDWRITPNVNHENYMEHVQYRWSWYQEDPVISTSSATYYMQGMCDPAETDPSARTYYTNCTKENNNLVTGGVLAPTPTNFHIHRKASDLTPLFKALYEYHQDVRNLGFYFANGGSGSAMLYPHFRLNTNNLYKSIGCDWLLEEPNPYDPSRPIFSDPTMQSQIQYPSICRPKDTRVSAREYNPLERDWCRDQALHPHKVRVAGPYLGAFHENLSLITVGRAVYDKLTKEFIGCIAVDFVFDSWDPILRKSRLTPNSEVSIVRYDDVGTVIASTAWDMSNSSKIVTIDMINAGVSVDAYQSLLSLVDYSSHHDYDVFSDGWNATKIRELYEGFVYHDVERGCHVSGYPIPPPPMDYEEDWSPEFMAIVTIPTAEVYAKVIVISDDIDDEVINLAVLSAIVGSVGVLVVIMIIVWVSRSLTMPLEYMNDVAVDIFDKNFADDDMSTRSGISSSGLNGSSRKFDDPTKPSRRSFTMGGDMRRSFTRGDGGGGDLRKSFTKVDSEMRKSFTNGGDNRRKSVTNKDILPEKARKKKLKRDLFLSRKFAGGLHGGHRSRCRPKTEIDEVVHQFTKMVSNFSGFSMAKSMKTSSTETKNGFNMKKEFEKLYNSRAIKAAAGGGGKAKEFKYNFDSSTKNSHSSSKSSSRTNARLHSGPNTKDNDVLASERTQMSESNFSFDNRKSRGSLFSWIVCLMVLPFLATTLTISGMAMYKLTLNFTYIIHEAKDFFVETEEDALNIYVTHRAHLVSVKMERALRDLHVLTRYTHWLLFNGVKRTQSFSQISSIVEEEYRNDTCDCAWDEVNQECFDKSTMDYRYSQTPFFCSQSQDNWANGDRNISSFPEVAYSAETVEFWENSATLPGYQEGSLATGYDSLYSRIRVLSALPVLQPMYNQDVKRDYYLGAYIGFESDGTLMGYSCDNPDLTFSGVRQESLKSAELYPNVCPVGKYGYDPRCREWYNTGKTLYEENGTDVYVTPPYVYSGEYFVGQSATSPIRDSVSGEYLGQTLIDFEVTSLLGLINDKNTPLKEGGFPILITGANEVFVDDTVVGPGYNGSIPMAITDVVFGKGLNCSVEGEDCVSRRLFQAIIYDMKKGGSGHARFNKTSSSGLEEHFHMAYHPVEVKSFAAIDNSDFSRGVQKNKHLSYSLALAENEEGLAAHFVEIERQLHDQVSTCLIVLIIVITLSLLFVIFVSYKVAFSITEPLLYLLELIGHINRLDSYDMAPIIDIARRGQSLEIVNVSKTMESLYRVVCSANMAFFTGDMNEAYVVLKDALKLYQRLDNKKGISIASNNLGNMMLTMYRTMEVTGEETVCGFTRRQIIRKGIAYFHESIRLGEKAYDTFYQEQGWSPVCLEFMQHLSNRYFNRAMFLLTVKDSHPQPAEIEELGFRDLQIARDMDLEIIEEGTQAGWGVRRRDKWFDVTLTRMRGHILLQEMGYPDDWDVADCLEEAFKTLKSELKRPGNSLLFQDVAPAGRMQQLETELIRYKMLKGDVSTAAKIAIRMLVEDEYTLIDSQLKAVEVLISYIKTPEFQDEESNSRINDQLIEYQRILKCQQEQSLPSSLEQQPQQAETTRNSARFTKMRNSSFIESQRGDFTMEIF